MENDLTGLRPQIRDRVAKTIREIVQTSVASGRMWEQIQQEDKEHWRALADTLLAIALSGEPSGEPSTPPPTTGTGIRGAAQTLLDNSTTPATKSAYSQDIQESTCQVRYSDLKRLEAALSQGSPAPAPDYYFCPRCQMGLDPVTVKRVNVKTAPAPADAQGVGEALKKEILDCVPTTWLDSLLTGPDKVVGSAPFTCDSIERLCKAIKGRLRDSLGHGGGK